MSSKPLGSSDMLMLMMSRLGAVAPIGILDVLGMDGTSYHWATRPITTASGLGITPLFTGNPPAWNAAHLHLANWDDTYLPWLLQAGPFHLSRSMQSNIGNFLIQNVSGDSIARDMSTLITASTFEGAVFGYREWNLEA
ncbi:MAG TPA: hypothetical protein VKF63_02780 [Terracidiphilus sp.]|nr:hypothetical protein [Terracidiphilus sp.]